MGREKWLTPGDENGSPWLAYRHLSPTGIQLFGRPHGEPQVSADVGFALRPIVIREQGITQPSMSGLVLSAHVEGGFSF